MPFILAIIGSLLIIAGARGKSTDLASLVKGDLTGTNNFVYWVIAILIVGGIGYANDFRGLSRSFLVLLLLVLILTESKNSTGGFFAAFTNSVSQITGGKNGQ